MCGRYTQKASPAELADAFALAEPAHDLPEPTSNAAPTQSMPVIPNSRDGGRVMVPFRWGLVPFWAKDIKIGSRLINARAETLASKPSFGSAYKFRRCLVPTTGFIEWQSVAPKAPKRPMFIRLRDERPFAFAGLWERWQMPAGESLHTFTIITTVANELMHQIHARMPVILAPDAYDLWLDVGVSEPEKLGHLLAPWDASDMIAWEISPDINFVRNDSAPLLEPVEGGLRLGFDPDG